MGSDFHKHCPKLLVHSNVIMGSKLNKEIKNLIYFMVFKLPISTLFYSNVFDYGKIYNTDIITEYEFNHP